MKHVDGILNVALVGAIGSGKSSVMHELERLGCKCVSLDDIGHGVMDIPEVKADVARAFGSDILDADGNVIRPRLAAAAFDTPEHTQLLNSITHPRINAQAVQFMQDCVDAGEGTVAVIEVSAGDFTVEAFAWADHTIYVYAPYETRLERACLRGNQTREDIIARMNVQPTEEEYHNLSDIVVDNSGTAEELPAHVA